MLQPGQHLGVEPVAAPLVEQHGARPGQVAIDRAMPLGVVPAGRGRRPGRQVTAVLVVGQAGHVDHHRAPVPEVAAEHVGGHQCGRAVGRDAPGAGELVRPSRSPGRPPALRLEHDVGSEHGQGHQPQGRHRRADHRGPDREPGQHACPRRRPPPARAPGPRRWRSGRSRTGWRAASAPPPRAGRPRPWSPAGARPAPRRPGRRRSAATTATAASAALAGPGEICSASMLTSRSTVPTPLFGRPSWSSTTIRSIRGPARTRNGRHTTAAAAAPAPTYERVARQPRPPQQPERDHEERQHRPRLHRDRQAEHDTRGDDPAPAGARAEQGQRPEQAEVHQRLEQGGPLGVRRRLPDVRRTARPAGRPGATPGWRSARPAPRSARR